MDLEPSGYWASAPEPLVGGFLIGAMVMAFLLGWGIRLGAQRVRLGRPQPVEKSGHEGMMLASILGLLSFLLAFTFGIALNRYETRRELVVSEANAIGSAYAVTQILSEPHRTRISVILKAYVDNRIPLAAKGRGDARRLVANDRLLTDLWAAVKAGMGDARDRGVAVPLANKMTEVLDHDSLRKLARMTRVPDGILEMLFLFAVVAAAMLGYVLDNMRARLAAGLMLVLLGRCMLLIVDLNRPMSGSLKESQLPMQLLSRSMASQPPPVFDKYQPAGALAK